MSLHDWALRWNVPAAALLELQESFGLVASANASPSVSNRSESWVQSAVRLHASRLGIYTFRNNVGALPDKTGRPVRYGLANDSAAMNRALKSADLIGVRPLVITEAHVGHKVGQFWSRECKPAGWRYTGRGREPAQLAWINLINSCGGDAAFATGPEDV